MSRNVSLSVLLMFVCMGCANGRIAHRPGGSAVVADSVGPAQEVENPSRAVTVSRGKPRKFVDGLGWVVGIPERVLLWDRRVVNHKVSDETVGQVVTYLDRHDLGDVHVRVNEYAPLDEFHRLRENRRVAAGWRYTFGALHLLGYTLLPGRVFGGDRYNPYTNTIYMYSNVSAIGLHDAAYAKDVHQRRYPGTYAAVQEIPFVGLWHRTNAVDTALDYLAEHGDDRQLRDGYLILYPKYGAAAGGSVDSVFSISGLPVFAVAGAVVGHVTSHRELRRLQENGRPRNSVPEIETAKRSPAAEEPAGSIRSNGQMSDEFVVPVGLSHESDVTEK